MACQPGRHLEDDPGATLILHGYPGKVASLTEWLLGYKTEDLGSLPELRVGSVVIEQRIEALLWPGPASENFRLHRYRDCQILRGLLVGSSLLRTANDPTRRTGDVVEVGLQDYAAVHGPIRGASLRPGDEPYDPLAVAMVSRANVYLAARQESTARPVKTPRLGPKRSADQGKPAPHERLVTRREVLDLGNPKGKQLRRIIEYLLAQGDTGYEVFRTLGTIRPLPKPGNWPDHDPVNLARLLLSWSEKQVRDHFHRLYTEGLVEALPRPGNQPWVYVLPEILSNPRSPFLHLPTPARLAALPEVPAPAPTGMPVAGPQHRADESQDRQKANDETALA